MNLRSLRCSSNFLPVLVSLLLLASCTTSGSVENLYVDGEFTPHSRDYEGLADHLVTHIENPSVSLLYFAEDPSDVMVWKGRTAVLAFANQMASDEKAWFKRALELAFCLERHAKGISPSDAGEDSGSSSFPSCLSPRDVLDLIMIDREFSAAEEAARALRTGRSEP